MLIIDSERGTVSLVQSRNALDGPRSRAEVLRCLLTGWLLATYDAILNWLSHQNITFHL